MAVNLSAIKDLLLPGLRGVEGQYEQIPAQYDKIFTKHDSKMALERTAEMRFLGYAQLKTEGGQTAFDNGAGERYVYNQEHTEIGLGYAITRKAIDDNLYKSQFAPSNLGLTQSFHQTKVRGHELGLVEVVINRLASDGITKSNLSVLLIVDVTLTSVVVESGLTTFSLELGKTQEAHFSGALKRHLGIMLGEDLVVLRRDLLVLAFNPTEAGEQKVFNG